MKYNVTGTYCRDEVVGWVPCTVEYKVAGTFHPGDHETPENRYLDSEVQFTTAERIDPFTDEKTSVAYSSWPFSPEEEGEICEMLMMNALSNL